MTSVSFNLGGRLTVPLLKTISQKFSLETIFVLDISKQGSKTSH